MTKQYISIGKTDLFYNSTGLYGNFTPRKARDMNFIDLKNLSRAVSNAHVWEKREKFCCSLWRSLFSIMTYFPYISTFNSSFSPLNCTDLSIKSLRERLLGIVHIHCKIKIMGKKSQNVYFWLKFFTLLMTKLPDLSYIFHVICISRYLNFQLPTSNFQQPIVQPSEGNHMILTAELSTMLQRVAAVTKASPHSVV